MSRSRLEEMYQEERWARAAAAARAERAEADAAALLQAIQERDATIADLRERLTRGQAHDMAAHIATAAKLRGDRAQAYVRAEKLEAELATLRNEIAEREATISKLLQQIEVTQGAYAELQQQSERWFEELRRAREALRLLGLSEIADGDDVSFTPEQLRAYRAALADPPAAASPEDCDGCERNQQSGAWYREEICTAVHALTDEAGKCEGQGYCDEGPCADARRLCCAAKAAEGQTRKSSPPTASPADGNPYALFFTDPEPAHGNPYALFFTDPEPAQVVCNIENPCGFICDHKHAHAHGPECSKTCTDARCVPAQKPEPALEPAQVVCEHAGTCNTSPDCGHARLHSGAYCFPYCQTTRRTARCVPPTPGQIKLEFYETHCSDTGDCETCQDSDCCNVKRVPAQGVCERAAICEDARYCGHAKFHARFEECSAYCNNVGRAARCVPTTGKGGAK